MYVVLGLRSREKVGEMWVVSYFPNAKLFYCGIFRSHEPVARNKQFQAWRKDWRALLLLGVCEAGLLAQLGAVLGRYEYFNRGYELGGRELLCLT